MKRVYRFALVNCIGIFGILMTCVSVWCMYFTGNKDWFIPMIFGGLITWFYIEVVTPKK